MTQFFRFKPKVVKEREKTSKKRKKANGIGYRI